MRWRRYLGGQLHGNAAIALDVDGDGHTELVYASGGRLIAKHPDDSIVWESAILNVDTIVGVADADGDGTDELAVTGAWPVPSRFFFVSPADGSVLFTAPHDAVDRWGQPQIEDFDGDGHPELYLGTGGCGNGNSGGRTAVLYSFCDGTGCGFDRVHELWRLASGSGNCGAGGALAELDGDPTPELVVSWMYAEVPVYDAATGTYEASMSAPTGSFDRAWTAVVPQDVDGDGIDEVFTYTNIYTAGVGARSLALFHHTDTGYALSWQVSASDPAADSLSFDVSAGAQDLDGDGTLEVAVSIETGATGTNELTIHATADGSTLASVTGVALAGLIDLDGDGHDEVVASGGGSLVGYRFDGSALNELFRIDGVGPIDALDPDSRMPEVLALQLDDDPPLELVAARSTSGIGRVGLVSYDVGASGATERDRFDADAETTVLDVLRVGNMTRDYEQLGVVTSDGYLHVLDRHLQSTTGNAGAEFSLPGMRIGGYAIAAGSHGQTPLVATLDVPTVIVRDSRGALITLDASTASLVSPPMVAQTFAGAMLPTLVDLDGDGTRENRVRERRGFSRRLRWTAPRSGPRAACSATACSSARRRPTSPAATGSGSCATTAPPTSTRWPSRPRTAPRSSTEPAARTAAASATTAGTPWPTGTGTASMISSAPKIRSSSSRAPTPRASASARACRTQRRSRWSPIWTA